MVTSIWKNKKNDLVLAVRTLRQLNFSSELMKTMYNKKQEQHKSQTNIMQSKLYELLPYTMKAIHHNVSLDNIFSMQDEMDRSIITDLHKK